MVSPLKYNASIEQHKNATELALQIPIANFRDGYGFAEEMVYMLIKIRF